MDPKILGILGLLVAANKPSAIPPSMVHPRSYSGKTVQFGYATPGKAGCFEKKVAKNKRRKQLAKASKRRNR